MKKVSAFLLCIATFNFSVSNTFTVRALDNYDNVAEIISMRSQYEKHFDNFDGTQVAYVDTTPIHYYQNGEWIEINNELVKDTNGNFTNFDNSMNVTLASDASSVNIGDECKIDNHLFEIDYAQYNITMDILDSNSEGSQSNDTLLHPIEIIPNESVIDEIDGIESKDLANKIYSVRKNKTSVAKYDSLLDGCCLKFSINPDSVQEEIVMENDEAFRKGVSYYIDAAGLTAKMLEDYSIDFIDCNGNTVFNIPAPVVYDNSNLIRYNNFSISLEEYLTGYILTLSPSDNSAINDNLEYPIHISQQINVNNSIYTYNLCEDYPTSYMNSSSLQIGGNTHHRCDALISMPSNALYSSDYITIEDAKLHLYFRSCNDEEYQRPLRVSALLSSYMPYWSGVSFQHVTELDRFDVSLSHYNSIDVTKIISAWQNYYRSNSKVGVYPYGLIIDAFYGYCAVYQVDSATGINTPYYTISYKNDSNYKFAYSSAKYNDIVSQNDNNPNNDIYNFEKRMNCYAYALQLYDSNHNPTSTFYGLAPGEMSLSVNPLFNTRSDLIYHYNNVISSSSQLINFTEQQMMYDSTVMGTNLQKITLSNENQFVLPTGYNESIQRIIAMNAGHDTVSSAKDFHFYVRHGNGSCTVHGGNCSIWSHKRGHGRISNTLLNSQNQDVPICDYNIAQLAYKASFPSITGTMIYDTHLRFYTIQLDTNVYNDGYYYNSSNDTTIYAY